MNLKAKTDDEKEEKKQRSVRTAAEKEQEKNERRRSKFSSALVWTEINVYIFAKMLVQTMFNMLVIFFNFLKSKTSFCARKS